MEKIRWKISEKVKTWTEYVEVDELAQQQINYLSSLPFIYKYIAIMPDVHPGIGSTVGTVIPTIGKLIPAAVGVDIGCGIMGVKLPFKATKINDVKELRRQIEKKVPVGFNQHDKPILFLNAVQGLIRNDVDKKTWLQFGTLGGGNHFIEISKDQNDDAWALVHTGSRGIGNTLATRHIQIAKKLMLKNSIILPDPNLAYFEENTVEFDNYLRDLNWAQKYAKYNRVAIMDIILSIISKHVYPQEGKIMKFNELVINCHHNYSQREKHFGKYVWVTRKGAVSAKKGEYGIIPGSMGDKTYIVKGKGNEDSFCSCSHGAGRKMSRAQAKKLFSTVDLKNQTEGVECRKDKHVVDEIPSAYKNIDEVMKSQGDLVDIIYVLKQMICIKG